MEVSALKHAGVVGRQGRSPLLRLQSDERLIALVRRGNHAAFEAIVNRYESRLLAFCRHLLGSREDAEDVLQEVLAAAFNAILADDRPINVRPWLYRIARNRSLNHLRRIQAVGVDSMDVHFHDHGASTADEVHKREEFRLLVGDIQDLPETQRTALLLREMDALSYGQIAEAMETTVPSVKSLLVRARVSLAEAAEARLLSCEEVRIELGEIAEGLRRRPGPLVRRHLKACDRCSAFRVQLKDTNKALAALLPIGPLVVLKKLALIHLGHSASAGSGATAAGSGAAAVGGGAATTVVAGSTASGVVSAGIGALATKAAAGLAVATIVTAGAVEVDHATTHRTRHQAASTAPVAVQEPVRPANVVPAAPVHKAAPKHKAAAKKKAPIVKRPTLVASTTTPKVVAKKPVTPPPPPGRTQTQTDTTILPTTVTTATVTEPPPPTAVPTSAVTTTPTTPVTTPTTTPTPTPGPPPPGPAPGGEGDPGTGAAP
jgi:RNA polymerase sigma factor (sigma-70 family)